MKKKTKLSILYLLLGVLLVVALTLVSYYSLHPLSRQVYLVDLSVGDYIGINLDKDALHFGTLRPGSVVGRPIILKAEQYPIAVTVFVEGLPFVTVEEPSFTLQQGESKAIRLFATVEKTIEKDTYNGTLVVLTKRL